MAPSTVDFPAHKGADHLFENAEQLRLSGQNDKARNTYIEALALYKQVSAVRPAPSFWRAARGTPPTSRADHASARGLKSAFGLPILRQCEGGLVWLGQVKGKVGTDTCGEAEAERHGFFAGEGPEDRSEPVEAFRHRLHRRLWIAIHR